MVTYTGYACFPPKTVSCVLSVDTMIGITVAPGCRDSSDAWLRLSVWKVKVNWYCSPVRTTTNPLYTSHCILDTFVHGRHSVALGQKPSPARTRDLHRSHGCNVQCPGNEIGTFHF